MPSPSADAIIADSLVKHFGDVHALNGVSLSVPTGTVLGLLGPNGAGKTTAVRMLTTILPIDGGSAHVLGVDVAQEPAKVRGLIGLAGQYAAVDEKLTGRENLRMMSRLTHQPRAGIAARSAELLHFFDLTEAADRTVGTYSGGMRRRLDLAASLVHHPPVLFLDEPTTGLDPRSRIDLWGVIEDLVADGTTLLLTTQYLEEADRLADNIAVIDHGLVIAEGTAAELKAGFGATIVEIAFADAATAAKAREAVAPRGPSEILVDGVTVSVKLDEGAKGVIGVVRAIDAADVEPEGLVVREPTLDDVFLSLTGRPAEEVVDDPDPAHATDAPRGVA
ncbi:MAG TPA: ATP-binding cassette domain-containing protein [Acidimicrobiales bacterium]